MHPARSLVLSLATATALTFAAAPTANACEGCGCEAGSKSSQPTSAKAHPHADGKARACSVDQSFEQDRQAILAMAGEFEVTFQFQETVAIEPGYELKDPYNSKATEFVEVVKDTGDFISLQHILVTERDGEPVVVKHWRQDWTYQDTRLLTYAGHRDFKTVELTPEQAAGKWTQAVYQVDDSPRYEGIGAWRHTGNRSAWESQITWRPLPRREHSKRSDYQVMVCRNRHTITPAGWVHEQDNRKVVLDEAGNPVKVLAHESGLNVYDRTDGVDFSAGEAYWKDTAAYWSDVRELWSEALAAQDVVNIATVVNDKPLFAQMFAIANDVRADGSYDDAHRDRAKELIHASITDK